MEPALVSCLALNQWQGREKQDWLKTGSWIPSLQVDAPEETGDMVAKEDKMVKGQP